MTAPSPGIIATTMLNADYPSHEASLDAIAREMAYEYRAMVDAGFVLQIDAPDLAMRTDIVWQIKRKLAEAAIRPVLLYPVRAHLPRTLRQGTDHHDQQHLQRLAHGRRLARQVTPGHRRGGLGNNHWGGVDETTSGRSRHCGGNTDGDRCLRDGICAKDGRHPTRPCRRFTAEHVDARGGGRRPGAGDDGIVQQPRHVRSVRKAKQHAVDRPRSRHRLVMERGRRRIDLAVAQGGQMA